MCVTMAFPLHEVERDQKIQMLQGIVEFRSVGSRHNRITPVEHQRANASMSGSDDLVG